jgi:restriction system protein
MAEISKARWGQYKKNVLDILSKHNDGLHWKDLFTKLEEVMPANEFENSSYESNGQRRRPYIVRFATIAIVKAGWLVKEKGIWTITDDGRDALVKYSTSDEIQLQSGKLYKEWHAAQPDDQSSQVQDREVEMVASLEEAEDNAFALIYQYLSDMDPYDFQDLVGVLLEVMGYYVSWIAPRGKDGGIDIIAFQDPLGATGRRIKVQVKRQADKVSRGVLSSFLGVLGDDDIGLFICTGGFSPEAMSTSRSEQTRRLTLIDAEGLMKLWNEYYEKIPQSKRSLLPLRTIHYLDRP